jgi:hypothetical protein
VIKRRHKKGGLATAFFTFAFKLLYWQRWRRPSLPLNQAPGWQTKPFRAA